MKAPEPCKDKNCLHLYCGTARLLPAKARLVWWKELREWFAAERKMNAASNRKKV